MKLLKSDKVWIIISLLILSISISYDFLKLIKSDEILSNSLLQAISVKKSRNVRKSNTFEPRYTETRQVKWRHKDKKFKTRVNSKISFQKNGQFRSESEFYIDDQNVQPKLVGEILIIEQGTWRLVNKNREIEMISNPDNTEIIIHKSNIPNLTTKSIMKQVEKKRFIKSLPVEKGGSFDVKENK